MGRRGAAGLVIGVLLGGVLTKALGWEAVFLVNVPLAGVAMLLAFPLIAPDGEREMNRTFDLPGTLSATLGLVAERAAGVRRARVAEALAEGREHQLLPAGPAAVDGRLRGPGAACDLLEREAAVPGLVQRGDESAHRHRRAM
jgi:MFS family permease